MRMGTVWINDFNVYFPHAPWGGYKQSGIGHELGKLGLDEYTETKHIFHNLAPAAINWFQVKIVGGIMKNGFKYESRTYV